LFGIDIDGGNDTEPRFGEKQPGNLAPIGTDSVLRDCDGLNGIHEHLVEE